MTTRQFGVLASPDRFAVPLPSRSSKIPVSPIGSTPCARAATQDACRRVQRHRALSDPYPCDCSEISATGTSTDRDCPSRATVSFTVFPTPTSSRMLARSDMLWTG
jgi:hypothetical protein